MPTSGLWNIHLWTMLKTRLSLLPTRVLQTRGTVACPLLGIFDIVHNQSTRNLTM